MLCAVRGAITVPKNQAEMIKDAVKELIETMIINNKIEIQGIVTLFFTMTPDLTTYNPARAIRETDAEWDMVPMLCSQESPVADMLPLCIRALIQWEAPDEVSSVKPVYLRDAGQLRPEFS